MYNGVDVHQTRDYIELMCTTFIDKISEKYLATWMKHMYASSLGPTPFPLDANWWRDFDAAVSDSDVKDQAMLAIRQCN